MNTTATALKTPARALVDPARARATMVGAGLDAIVASNDENLFYLSGHAPDSVLAHFFPAWAAAVLPRTESAPPALITSDYDLAYLVTHPTWMDEVRTYGAEWSSATALLRQIDAGEGVESELRAPLRALFRQTRASRAGDLVGAIVAYLRQHLPKGATVGFDDLRLGARVAAAAGGWVRTSDALPALRRMRLVKTEAEIALLRRASIINEAAVIAAAGAIRAGAPWLDMVHAYRASLAAAGANPIGNRGMLFAAGPDGGFVLDHDYMESHRFRAGDSVVLDAIARYRLYHADMARTAVLGEPRPRHRFLHRAVAEALAEAEAKLRPGAHTQDALARAIQVLEGHGLDARATTLVFHPIGLDVFDYGDPSHASDGWMLEADTVVNFEVFFRDAEYGGMHLEDSVVVRARGLDYFGTSPRELMVVGA